MGVSLERAQFDLEVHVQHWSACWGGIVPKQKVDNTPAYLKKYTDQTPWLKTFLENANPLKINIETIDKPLNARAEKLGGTRFWALVRFQPNEFEPDLTRNWVVVTCVDGETIYSPESKYDPNLVGNGLFEGYRLNEGRHRYSLDYWLKRNSEGTFDNLWFKSPEETIVASHLYSVDKDTNFGEVDLRPVRPLCTSLIIHERTGE